MHEVQSVDEGRGVLVRDQLVSELEQELESEARQVDAKLTPADTFSLGSANTFVTTSPALR